MVRTPEVQRRVSGNENPEFRQETGLVGEIADQDIFWLGVLLLEIDCCRILQAASLGFWILNSEFFPPPAVFQTADGIV